MNTDLRIDTFRPVATGLLAAGLMLACALPAAARTHGATVTGPNGQSVQRQVTRADGQVEAVTTGPNGKTASREVSRSAAGTTATATGPAGRSATRSTQRTATGSQTTVTGPNGQGGTITVTHP